MGYVRSLSARRAWIEIVDYIIDYVNDAVALRKESVDRNSIRLASFRASTTSLSARRAWIEIARIVFVLLVNGVALRKESVDRNVSRKNLINGISLSLSARRAWIEIPAGCWRDSRRARRSPQGERG